MILFHIGELIGFTHMGEINDHLLLLEKQINGEQSANNQTLATSVLVLMVRGLFTDLAFPYASFPASSLSGDQIVPIFYEAVLRLERCGFRVACTTLDGNSANRKFFKIIGQHNSSDNITYYTKNPCSLNRKIFFISDPPHLIKTTRNCLASPKRNMEVFYHNNYYSVNCTLFQCSLMACKFLGDMSEIFMT